MIQMILPLTTIKKNGGKKIKKGSIHWQIKVEVKMAITGRMMELIVL